MTLGNMHELGVQHLIAYCLNDACRHQALIDVSKYSDEKYRRFSAERSAGSAAASALILGRENIHRGRGRSRAAYARLSPIERAAGDADEAVL
jgi:hypothetical protein